MMIKHLSIILLAILFPSLSWGNGGSFYFEDVLQKGKNDWNGYRVLFFEPTGGSLAVDQKILRDWYELTYVNLPNLAEQLQKIVLFHLSLKKTYSINDIDIYKKYKNDDGVWEKFLVFKENHLNKSSLLILIPNSNAAKFVPRIQKIQVSEKSLPFLQNPPKNINISLIDAFDMNDDEKVDILIFRASNKNYTRTYILGYKDEWEIFDIVGPR